MVFWHQYELAVGPFPRGLYPITREIERAATDLKGIRIGLLHVFILHTSAALTINENADPDVPYDLNQWLDRVAPERAPYRHTVEGPDDMPAHIKASVCDSGLTLPVRDGRLALGTWQGVFLCEFRENGGERRLLLTLCGE